VELLKRDLIIWKRGVGDQEDVFPGEEIAIRLGFAQRTEAKLDGGRQGALRSRLVLEDEHAKLGKVLCANIDFGIPAEQGSGSGNEQEARSGRGRGCKQRGAGWQEEKEEEKKDETASLRSQ
jgi:hypothetical protein